MIIGRTIRFDSSVRFIGFDSSASIHPLRFIRFKTVDRDRPW